MMENDLLMCLEEKIKEGFGIMKKLEELNVCGVDKLIRKINQEVKFLTKVRSTREVKKEYLQSSNLSHLNAMVERLMISKGKTDVMKPFKMGSSKLVVDIVCDGGGSWIKVIARNPKALTLISMGNAEYGQKSIIDQAKSYLKWASNCPFKYKPPKVIFHFACGIEMPLANKLEQLGIIVEGERVDSNKNVDDDTDDEEFCNSPNSIEMIRQVQDQKIQPESKEINTLNLDVSTLLAYVTNMTNGRANLIFNEPLLAMQAEWERSRPVKPILDELFQNKALVVCKTAYDNFMNIIKLIGGPAETCRTHQLMNRVKMIEDATEGRLLELNLGGKIKPRSRVVFATGEHIKSITVSANEGFIRAAQMQGIELTVILHEPRSLSEMKEINAINLS